MYDEVGTNIAAGRGFTGGFAAETFERPLTRTPDAPEIGIGPVYPLFLGVIYRTVGHHFTAVRVIQAAISTLMLFPLYALTRWALGASAATAAVALSAVYPAFIVYNGFILTEALATALLVAAVWAVAYAWRATTATTWLVAGVLMGITILLRAELLVICVPVVVLTLWRDRSRRAVGLLLLYLAAVSATMAPWTIRNYRTFHRLVPVSAHDGDTLWISVKGWREWHVEDPELQTLVRGTSYVEQSEILRAAAIRAIRAHPIQFLQTRLERFPDFFLSGHTGNVVGVTESIGTYLARRAIVPLSIKLGLLALNTALIGAGCFAIAQMLIHRAAGPGAWLMLAPVVCISVVHFFLYATARYQIPMLPFVFAFAVSPWCGDTEVRTA